MFRTTIRYTGLKEKCNNVSLLEFYINYLPRYKYYWLHNIHDMTFCILSMYVFRYTRDYFQQQNLRKIKLEAHYDMR